MQLLAEISVQEQEKNEEEQAIQKMMKEDDPKINAIGN